MTREACDGDTDVTETRKGPCPHATTFAHTRKSRNHPPQPDTQGTHEACGVPQDGEGAEDGWRREDDVSKE